MWITVYNHNQNTCICLKEHGNACAQCAYTHVSNREGERRVHLVKPAAAAPFLSCNSASVPVGTHSRGKQETPILSFQRVILNIILNSSQQNQKIWAIRKVLLAFFLLHPLVFCGGPWQGFRHRSTQLSETESRSHFLCTANSAVSKNGTRRGFAQHFPSHEQSLLPL